MFPVINYKGMCILSPCTTLYAYNNVIQQAMSHVNNYNSLYIQLYYPTGYVSRHQLQQSMPVVIINNTCNSTVFLRGRVFPQLLILGSL